MKSNFVSKNVNTSEMNDSTNWLTVNSPVMRGGASYSATSDVFLSQINKQNVNELVNMLTSDINGGNNITSEIDTVDFFTPLTK